MLYYLYFLPSQNKKLILSYLILLDIFIYYICLPNFVVVVCLLWHFSAAYELNFVQRSVVSLFITMSSQAEWKIVLILVSYFRRQLV